MSSDSAIWGCGNHSSVEHKDWHTQEQYMMSLSKFQHISSVYTITVRKVILSFQRARLVLLPLIRECSSHGYV